MKVKTAELKGVALDWAAAMATGMNPRTTRGFGTGRSFVSVFTVGPFKPSTSWAQGGPLIEQMGISLRYSIVTGITPPIPEFKWWSAATIWGQSFESDKPLVAACRAIAWSKFGDEVDIPDELTETDP